MNVTRCLSKSKSFYRSLSSQPEQIKTLISARWVIPVNEKNIQSYLENYSIAINNKGLIADILPTEDAKLKYQKCSKIDKKNHILMPGIVNVHQHSPMQAFRGFADDLNLFSWLFENIFPAEKEFVSKEFVRDGSKLSIAEMLKSGTTSFVDMYYFGEETADEAAKTGIRAAVGLTVLDNPTAWAATHDEYFSKTKQLLSQYQNHPNVSIWLAPHAPYTVSDDLFNRVIKFSQKENVKITCHIHETADEVERGIKDYGIRPIKRLDNLGLLNNNLLAVHCTQLDLDEIKLFAKKGVSVAHCPESNCKLASGISPVVQLTNEGVNVGIGTDSVASNNDLDMFSEMRTAAFLGKISNKNPIVNSAPEVIKMATLNGAKAMGLQDQIGSLEIGKQADIIALDMNSSFHVPIFNPISHVVYSTNRDSVSDVWIGGKRVVQNKQLLAYDEDEILSIAHHWGNKLKEFKKNK